MSASHRTANPIAHASASTRLALAALLSTAACDKLTGGDDKDKPVEAEAQSATLLPAAETTARKEAEAAAAESAKPQELNVDTVFAKLKQIGSKSGEESE